DFQQEIPCLILNEITDKLPAITFDPSNLNIPSDISLADPNFYKSDTIDMLIGSQFFWQLMADGHIELGKNLPMLQKTRLGWIISGPMPMASSSNFPCTLCSFNELNDQLSKFWPIEEFPTPQHSAEEQLCEDLFNNTTRRSIEGRFIIKIPFVKPVTELGESKRFAIKRQLSLERKLEKNINLAADYKGFMHEYKALGHMSLTTENQHSSQSHFYLPHHAVIKEESTTTKLRVVFDGSSKSSIGVPLNDIQGAGVNNEDPIIQLGGSSKILGIIWLPSEDLLQYNIKIPSPTKATKRSVLSTIAQVYDPLGLESPVIINVKILILKIMGSQARLG
ncbi:hypothetical protein Trydic_g18192, partial [Trypoxylus dichotomus]